MPGGSATAFVVARPRLAYRGSTREISSSTTRGPSIGLARLPFSPPSTPPPPPPPNTGRPSTAAVVGASAGGTAAVAAAQVAPAGRGYGSF